MGIYKASTVDICDALENALDKIEGDFTDKQLQLVLERLKLYPFVSDKNKSVAKYSDAKNKLIKFDKGKE